MKQEQAETALEMLADVYAEGMEKALRNATRMMLDDKMEDAGQMVRAAYMAIVAETVCLTLVSPDFWTDVMGSIREMANGIDPQDAFSPQHYEQAMAGLEEKVLSV